MMNTTTFLLNKTILVTRPVGREKNLSNLILNAGGSSIHFPVIQIESNLLSNNIFLSEVQHADMAIFISPTAVEQTFKHYPALPKQIALVAIGKKTEETLNEHGVNTIFSNAGFDSESLLTHAELQTEKVKNKQIIIIRGIGGRAFLGDELEKRGANVKYIETYKRCLPDTPLLTINDFNSLSAITTSSNEGLNNLVNMLESNNDLFKLPIVVPSKTAYANAKNQGFSQVLLADNATDEACLDKLKYLFTNVND